MEYLAIDQSLFWFKILSLDQGQISSIQRKKMKFEYKSVPLKQNWDQELPKYWFDNSPLKTHFMNGVSLMIPVAENAVIHTIKETQKELTNPQLKLQIAEMIAQENWHSYSHRKYNEWLTKIGLPGPELASEYMHFFITSKKRLDRLFGKRLWLPGIVGGEHNAVCMMEYLLERPAMLATMHPHFRQAWVWHCIEEIEHKGSSMDMWLDTKVLQRRKKLLLNFTCIVAFVRINYFIMKNMFALLKHDNELWKWRTLKDGLSFFLGRDGIITKTFVPFFKCLVPNWNPWDHDTRYLIEQYNKVALSTPMSAEELAQIDVEFHGCIEDIENIIKEHNKIKII